MKSGLKQVITRTAIFLSIIIGVRLLILLVFSYSNLYKFFAHSSIITVNKTDITTTLVVMLTAFAIYNRKSLAEYTNYPKRYEYTYFGLSIASLCCHYILRFYTVNLKSIIIDVVGLMLLLCFGGILFYACFGKDFIEKFRNSIIVFVLFGLCYYFTTQFVQFLWIYLARTISALLHSLFQLFDPSSVLIAEASNGALRSGGGPTISFFRFSATIGKSCSGIDSLLLFTTLYLLIVCLDYHRLKKGPAVFFFFFGAIGIFFTNIIRIFLLFIVGAFISSKLAVGLFHTNIGWVLFFLFFLAFWWIASKFVYKKPNT